MKTKPAIWLSCLALHATTGFSAQPTPGTLLWSLDLGDSIRSSPSLGPDGTIYVSAVGGLHAVTNGGVWASNKWTVGPGGGGVGVPVVGADGTVYVGGTSFFALGPDSSLKWSVPLTNGIYYSTAAIGFDGTIYFVVSGCLYAVSPGGTLKWQRVIDETSTPGRMLSPIVAPDGTIYVGGYYNPVFYAIHADGTVKWSYGGGSGESGAIGTDGTIYISLGLEPVRALSAGGALIWASQVYGNGPPVVGPDGTIYVADQDRALTAISPTGEKRWRSVGYSVPLLPTVPAVDSSGMIYYCVSNSVFAVTSQGVVDWIFPSGYPVSSGDVITSPTLGPDGTIYTGVASKLFAIAGTNSPTGNAWPMFHQNPRHTGKVEKPSLQEPRRRSDAGFEFQLYGQLGAPFTIQASTNLNTWTSLTSFVATTVPVEVVDFTATNFPIRFYRASSP